MPLLQAHCCDRRRAMRPQQATPAMPTMLPFISTSTVRGARQHTASRNRWTAWSLPFTGKQRDFFPSDGGTGSAGGGLPRARLSTGPIDLPEQELDRGVVILNVVQTVIAT